MVIGFSKYSKDEFGDMLVNDPSESDTEGLLQLPVWESTCTTACMGTSASNLYHGLLHRYWYLKFDTIRKVKKIQEAIKVIACDKWCFKSFVATGFVV